MSSQFHMADVGGKRITKRRAVATGSIYMGADAFRAVQNKALPKGDALAMAEIAGIAGAKKTADLLPLCHPLPLDYVDVHFELNDTDNSVTAYALVVAEARTGVEMEALTAVQSALLAVWDLTKPVDAALRLGDTRLLVKEGGKSGLWIHPDGIPAWLEKQFMPAFSWAGVTAAVLVMSDRAAAGVYSDQSGAALKEHLEQNGADVLAYDIIPDDALVIEKTVLKIIAEKAPRVLLASGGTGPGQRDVTPDVLRGLYDLPLEGLGEMLRRESAAFTNTAWLSRMGGGLIGDTLVIMLPGSLKAVDESWQILEPCLPKALAMIEKQRAGLGRENKDLATRESEKQEKRA